ncbi:helix-turn-helix domain-containing protein [Eubacterium sp. am_0171]|uniref:Predicted transcriptional regulator n=1 Tax=Faecalicatena contorta TaxID=39482 RepID=A0A174DIN3_9FIRM|nr:MULTISPECIES: AAA family ATPase [Clostridia]MSC82849.1 AAA family ATPase [Eubacterium sp. BIOML-A1]MSD04995.1 AAA family ATPase [Eubacterium sp. BIOML-A2]RYT25187.1 helix-turn-helix domain-containing protein [Eubacterium sp. am_0171]CUO25057.1 Predicted transcriptional regulator [[Eubacterium] contortum] [Faecalicatena contorta]
MKTKFNHCLTALRSKKGCTQTWMAEQLGISRSTYSNYEAGKRAPDFETLERIADVLECSIDELFGRNNNSGTAVFKEEKAPYCITPRISGKKMTQKLGIGVQDFRKLREWNSYYVDKTGMIREFLESNMEVTLITRPRRFGKTLNMSMIAEFFDCTKESRGLFEGTYIGQTEAMRECNQHPVIFLSFLNAKGESEKELLGRVCDVLALEYERYWAILHDNRTDPFRREKIDKIYAALTNHIMNETEKEMVSFAIAELCRTLQEYYNDKVFLFIDEYDTPFISASVNGYYKEVRGFLSALFSSALKGNTALDKAVLTGIQRIAKGNIFSGLNNISVCTVNDPEYAQYFGFTEDETEELLSYYGMELTEAVRRMYDGYLFGEIHMYNPWSVIFYASRKKLHPYWVNTGENSIIEHAMDLCGDDFHREYKKLLEQGSVSVMVELDTSFFEKPGKAALWGMLINAGMVTVGEEIRKNLCIVRIPNEEVSEAFQRLTAHCLRVEYDDMADLVNYLRTGDMEEFVYRYQKVILTLPSYHDLKDENSYHMMMLGMCACLYGEYEIKSNRESGEGRSDIILRALRDEEPNIILEFKYTKDHNQNLEKLAQDALNQIRNKKYDAEMKGPICYIGLAHCGKKAKVVWLNTGQN